MEDIKTTINQGFFSYIFNLSKLQQSELFNFIQYSLLCIVPVLLLIFYVKKYGLKATYRDTSLYIVSITLLSIILLITGIFFIDRIINYIPTLSGVYYNVANLTNISIVLIMTLLLIRVGYMERTGILLYRLDNIFNHLLSFVGVKTPSKFSIIDGERDQWSLDKSYRKAYDIIKNSGGSDEKAKDFGNRVANKLAEFKKIQRTTDAEQIMKLSKYDSVIGTESSTGSGNNSNNSSLTTLNPTISQQYAIPPPLPTQGPKQVLPDYNNMYANTKNPLQNAATPGMSNNSNPFMKSTEGMFMGGGSGDNGPEPANGALSSTKW
jgi:hypothetical protein